MLPVVWISSCTACRVKADDKKRKKKKPKLDMHEQQLFIDGPDVSCFTEFGLWLLSVTIISER